MEKTSEWAGSESALSSAPSPPTTNSQINPKLDPQRVALIIIGGFIWRGLVSNLHGKKKLLKGG